MKTWEHVVVIVSYREDALVEGGWEQCNPSNEDELVVEMERKLGADPLSSFSGGKLVLTRVRGPAHDVGRHDVEGALHDARRVIRKRGGRC